MSMNEDDLFGLDHTNDILGHLDDEALHQKHLWPGDLVELAEVIRAQLLREEVKDDALYLQMERVLLAMSFLCGGRNYYLPKGERIKKALRDKRIYDEFDGKNIRGLSNHYKLSEQKVYEVVREQRQLHKNRIQHNLFPNEQA
ncbi:Mor transcription activator family protein [Endozoicomonas numazuensis]|uniref:Mor transcription activator domain-containing protein n=1 Tax=Endozoicomonas numazuensis TaxID=1137799 RepID=A0A081NL63_9GAMM|nr:Mor transcription activator family protein [Endozoicomonas numazuensis]KEQ19186.1 hypothetical protein GZ78_04110 [Endozoicomonas numazuensis]